LELRRDQAASALHNLAKRSLPDTVRHYGDGVWMYVASTEADVRTSDVVGEFVAVGRTLDNKTILSDQEGRLYKAEPLNHRAQEEGSP
jgi:hypothetical protein